MEERLIDVENQLFEIHNLHEEEKKWRTILNHWIKRNFDFDVEKQMEKDLLAFCSDCEPPTVGVLQAKNMYILPQLEPLLRKHQLEIAEYIKKINNRVTTTVQPQQQQTLYQTQKSSNPIHHQRNQYNLSNDHLPQSQQQHYIRQRSVQNQHLLHRQKQQQRELAWLEQISRPGHVPTGPGPGSDRNRGLDNMGWRNSGHSNNSSLQIQQQQQQRHRNVEATRPVQLQRLPVTIEKINNTGSVSHLSSPSYNQQPVDRPLPTLTRYPGLVRKMSSATTTVSSSNVQEYIDDLSRLCAPPGSTQKPSQQQRHSSSFVYACQTCGARFRLKSAAQLHIAKVHPVKPKQPQYENPSNLSCSKCYKRFRETMALQIHEANCQGGAMAVTEEVIDKENPMPIIMSVAGGGKRYVRKDPTKVVSVPSGLSINVVPPVSNNNSTTLPATSTVSNRVLDEITISDDDEPVEEKVEKHQQNGSVSISIAPVDNPVSVGQTGIENQLYGTNEEESQIQNERNSIQKNSSTPSSTPSARSASRFILSSKLSSLLSSSTGGVRVGDKRPASLSTRIESQSTSASTSPIDKRNRSCDQSLSSSTLTTQDITSESSLAIPPENLEVVPEINLYTDDQEEYDYENATYTTDDVGGVISINTETIPYTANSNSGDFEDHHVPPGESGRRASESSFEMDSVMVDEDGR